MSGAVQKEERPHEPASAAVPATAGRSALFLSFVRTARVEAATAALATFALAATFAHATASGHHYPVANALLGTAGAMGREDAFAAS